MKEVLSSLSELIRSLSRIVSSEPSIAFESDIRRLENAKKVLSDYSSNNEPRIIQNTTALTPEQILPVIEKVFGPGSKEALEERYEQVHEHGFDVINDLNYGHNELLKAALFSLNPDQFEYPYNWRPEFRQKIINKTEKQRLRVAASFVIAALDRLFAIEEMMNSQEQEFNDGTNTLENL